MAGGCHLPSLKASICRTPRIPFCGSIRGEAALQSDKKLRSKLKQGKWQMEAWPYGGPGAKSKTETATRQLLGVACMALVKNYFPACLLAQL